MEELYKRIRKANLGISIGGGIFFIVIGIAMAFLLGNKESATFFMPHKNYESVAAENLKEEKWYKLNINEIYDYYGTDDDGYYFIIPVKNSAGEETYMGLYVYNGKHFDALEISDATYNALENDTALPDKHLKGRGYVYNMSINEMQYFRGYFEEMDAPEEVTSKLVYKTLVYTPASKVFSVYSVVWGIFGCICAIIGILMMLYYLTGRYKKGFDNSIAKYNISEYELISDLANARKIASGKAEVGDKYILIYSKPALIRIEDLIWVYTHITTTKHSTYGIPTGTTTAYKLRLWDRNKASYDIMIRGELDGKEALEVIEKKSPHTILGYSQEIANVANNNFNEMVRAVDKKRFSQSSSAE